jgi:hypothetical protein
VNGMLQNGDRLTRGAKEESAELKYKLLSNKMPVDIV